MPAFVGRAEPLARLTAVFEGLTARPGALPDALAPLARAPGPVEAPPSLVTPVAPLPALLTPGGAGPRAVATWPGLVLVTGEAGIGKTALLTRFAERAAAAGATVVWGTCWDGDQAPAWWPWTQALRALLAGHPDLAAGARPDLGAILPELAASPASHAAGTRVQVLDAAADLLGRAATAGPLAVVLDDLHWADESTVDLLRFLARQPRAGALMLVGAYRPDEPAPGVAAALADLATIAEPVPLRGLTRAEVAELVRAVTGSSGADWPRLVHERSGGHPFFARELCRLLVATGSGAGIPVAVREAIGGRRARLSPPCGALLDAASVAGAVLLPDVLAEVMGTDPAGIAALTAEAAGAGIVAPDAAGTTRFVHDLYRETLYAALPPARRLDLHHRVAVALLHRHERGGPVFPAELARHFTAALGAATSATAPAVAWAHAAAGADAARFAFAEAAGHLTRLRDAVAAGGRQLPEDDLIGVLTAEAELRRRAGNADGARALLDLAWGHATGSGRAELLGAVALGLDRIDARFAMPRADLVAVLDTARDALSGTGNALEATVTAALARQLQHSVPADRPRAGPLADRAVRIARGLDDPATLASCLLAQHDTLWVPGSAPARAAVAAEIAGLATRAGDPERHAQALLLTASAQLESGSPAFRATLAEFAYLTERLRQPRHDYMLRTRQAALAILDGDIDAGERLSAEAVALGEAAGEGDTGNVRMSQRLEIVRARGEPAELRALADEAVRWWVGAPAHAHAVAAGFRARAGDLDAARRHLDTVLALDEWHTDRSYLWSIFVGEMVTAAVALGDRPLCTRLLEELAPLADACAVNAALVCFMGAHAHRIGLLHAALGAPAAARRSLERAAEIHRRLGARAWESETGKALAALAGPSSVVPSASASPDARLRRVGDMWEATYRGRTAFVRDVKGLHDLAALLARPGTDLPAIDLAAGEGSGRAHAVAADPMLDRAALAAYRRRLAELDDELADAGRDADLSRQQRASDEREHLLAELRRATRPGGAVRTMANTAAERARKAVTARIRDAIRRVAEAHPEFGAHLDRSVRTGTTCRYDP